MLLSLLDNCVQRPLVLAAYSTSGTLPLRTSLAAILESVESYRTYDLSRSFEIKLCNLSLDTGVVIFFLLIYYSLAFLMCSAVMAKRNADSYWTLRRGIRRSMAAAVDELLTSEIVYNR